MLQNFWDSIDPSRFTKSLISSNHAPNLFSTKSERDQDFDEAFMNMAWEISKLSRAERLKVGCILTLDRQIVSTGFNGTPAGFDTNVCETPDGKTSDWTIHAEENATLWAARLGHKIQGSTAYVTHCPCVPCARKLLQAGVVRIVWDEAYRDPTSLNTLSKYVRVEQIQWRA